VLRKERSTRCSRIRDHDAMVARSAELEANSLRHFSIISLCNRLFFAATYPSSVRHLRLCLEVSFHFPLRNQSLGSFCAHSSTNLSSVENSCGSSNARPGFAAILG